MTEQQKHLASLMQQRDSLAEQIESIKNSATNVRDLYLKVLGAIEYLNQIGVSLPEPEPTQEVEEQVEEGEVEATEES